MTGALRRILNNRVCQQGFARWMPHTDWPLKTAGNYIEQKPQKEHCEGEFSLRSNRSESLFWPFCHLVEDLKLRARFKLLAPTLNVGYQRVAVILVIGPVKLQKLRSNQS